MRLKHDDSVNRIIVEIDRNSSAQTGLPLCGAGMWLFCRKLRRFRLIFRQKRLSPPNSWHGWGRPIHRRLWTKWSFPCHPPPAGIRESGVWPSEKMMLKQ
jgi:hypothetical protein